MPAGLFEWNITLGELLVAIGTLALAGFTWRLGIAARDDVATSRGQLEAQDMPYVIATPNPANAVRDGTVMPWSGSGNRWELSMRLANIGKGPAIVRDVQLDLEHEYLMPMRRQVPVGPDREADVTLHGSWEPPGGEQSGLLRI